MIIRIFSVFDPVSVLGVSFNWFSLIGFVIVLPLGIFLVRGKRVEIFRKVIEGLSLIFKDIAFPNFLGLIYFRLGLFLLISVNNVFGLFSFVFTGTSHLIVTLRLGVVVWIIGVLIGWIKKFRGRSAHLVPEGAPLVLAPFIVLIERISLFIRPVTLSVRLAANIIAGHLIIGLISRIRLSRVSRFWVSVFLQSLILVLEWAVVFIQAFVFRVLVILYSLERY